MEEFAFWNNMIHRIASDTKIEKLHRASVYHADVAMEERTKYFIV